MIEWEKGPFSTHVAHHWQREHIANYWHLAEEVENHWEKVAIVP